jgi:hypothetical protein
MAHAVLSDLSATYILWIYGYLSTREHTLVGMFLSSNAFNLCSTGSYFKFNISYFPVADSTRALATTPRLFKAGGLNVQGTFIAFCVF